jgi:hypothetical protein
MSTGSMNLHLNLFGLPTITKIGAVLGIIHNRFRLSGVVTLGIIDFKFS